MRIFARQIRFIVNRGNIIRHYLRDYSMSLNSEFCHISVYHLHILLAWGQQVSLVCVLPCVLLHLSFYGGWATGFLLLFCMFSFIRWIEHRLLYQPEEPCHARLWTDLPFRFNLSNYESIYFVSEGYRLHGYFFKCPTSGLINTSPTILFCHGNAGNIGHRLMNINLLVHQCHANVFIFDYRGYGRSQGRPFEQGLYADARASLAYLRSRNDIDQNKVVLFGRSLGGAVAIQLCCEQLSTRSVSAIIVENTFTSVPAISKVLFNFPLLRSIPDWFLQNRYDSLNRMGQVKIPILFISGQKDALVPPQMMQKLYNSCDSSNKQFAIFSNAGHNDTWTSPNYSTCISTFLTKYFSENSLYGTSKRQTAPVKEDGLTCNIQLREMDA